MYIDYDMIYILWAVALSWIKWTEINKCYFVRGDIGNEKSYDPLPSKA
jgi:hypothetical protein